jgi:hypothetical protein
MAVPPHAGMPPVPGVDIIRVRDLGAAVRVAPAVAASPDVAGADHERLLDALFAHGAILPAPLGLVFRSADSARKWLEQNYIGLAEGVAYLAGRCEAGVHGRPASRAPSDGAIAALERDAGDAMHALRQSAVAFVPLANPIPPVLLSVAFLLKAIEWREFSEEVREQERRYAELRFEQTGPWVPHDFVHLDLGV